MKKLVKILIGFLVVAGIGAIILVFNLDPILEKLRPKLNEVISSAVKQPTSLGKISAKLFPSVAIEINDVTLKGNSSVSVKSLLLNTSLPNLLSKNINISKFSIDGGNIRLVKESDGRIAFGNTAQAPAATEEANAKESSKQNEPKQSEQGAAINFNVQEADIQNSSFTFVDNSGATPNVTEVSDIDATIKDLSLAGGNFNLNANLLSKALNSEEKIPVQLQAHVVLGAQGAASAQDATVKISNVSVQCPFEYSQASGVKLNLKSNEIKLADLAAVLAVLKSYSPTGSLKPDLEIIAKNSFPNIKGKLALDKINLTLPGAAGTVGPINGAIDFYGQLFNANLEAFGGKIESTAKLIENNKGSLTINAVNFDLAELSKTFLGDKSSLSLAGKLDNFTAQALASLSNPTSEMSANVSAKSSKGEIKGVNVFKDVLGKISEIPGLEGTLLAFVPEKYQPVLAANGTQYDSLTLSAAVTNGSGHLQSFTLIHPIYLLDGDGNFNLSGNFNINAKLRLTPLLTASMVAKQPRLALLQDKEGNIVIPVIIRKEGDSTLVLPDAKDLLARAATNTAKEAGKKALDKVSPGLGKMLDSIF